MYCYNCTTSEDINTLTLSVNNVSEEAKAEYAKIGNGYARVTSLTKSNNNYLSDLRTSVLNGKEETEVELTTIQGFDPRVTTYEVTVDLDTLASLIINIINENVLAKEVIEG